MRKFVFIFILFFSFQSTAAQSPENLYSQYAKLLNETLSSPLYAQLVIQEKAQAARYNSGETSEPRALNSDLVIAIGKFEEAFGRQIKSLAYEFALTFPEDVSVVDHDFRGVVFKAYPESLLHDVFYWNSPQMLFMPQIANHQVQYKSFATKALRLIKKHAGEKYSDFFKEVEESKNFQDLLLVETIELFPFYCRSYL